MLTFLAGVCVGITVCVFAAGWVIFKMPVPNFRR